MGSTVKLYRGDRIDGAFTATTQDIADGFVRSRFLADFEEGVRLSRCILAYVAATDGGLNATMSGEVIDPDGTVRNVLVADIIEELVEAVLEIRKGAQL